MSKLAIFNMAISSVGGRVILASDLDEGLEAEQCRLWYDTARDFIFNETYWPSIKTQTKLVLIQDREFGTDWTDADPPAPWRFTYAEPAGMLRIRYLFDAKDAPAQDQPYSHPQFDHGILPAGQSVIYTNVENAAAAYTQLQENPGLWETSLRLAVSFQLAALIAPTLPTDIEYVSLVEKRRQMYVEKCREQQAQRAEHQTVEDTNRIIDARRGYTDDDRRYSIDWRPFPEAIS
jgi:hypothetical protein